jgi:hypothetical protein
MRAVIFLGVFATSLMAGCSKNESRPMGAAGTGGGITDTGGGTMNNPTGIEGAGGAEALATGAAATAPPPSSTNVVTPPGTGSVSSTAGPEGGVTGGGAGAASPANPHGTGTGPTTP